jgi:DHA3 family macrolide efflux protein-like MFS transporter
MTVLAATMPGMRNFVLIWAGQTVSVIGSRLTSFALGIWVLRETGSTTAFALIFVAMALPALLISPIAGALVDRWDRRVTMIACDAICALTMLALALLLANDALAIWHIYAGVGITAVANAFLQPAYWASIPLLTPKDRLTRVNGMVQTGFALAQVGGPLLAGVLVAAVSMHGVLIVDALTYVVATLLMAIARVPRPVREPDAEDDNVWREAAIGWRYVRERPGLFGLLAIFGVSNFLFGIASIAITPLVLSFADTTQLGLQMSIGGAGLLLGGLGMSLWGGPRRKIHGVLGFSALAGIALAAHGLAPSFALVVVAGFVFFLTLPVINASNASLWQSKVPPALQGRCFAIQRVLSESAMPVGFIIAGPLAERVFEPLMARDGALASTVGAVIGSGVGRGLGLMFIVLGIAMTIVAAFAYAMPVVRQVEDDLPDAELAATDAANPLESAA